MATTPEESQNQILTVELKLSKARKRILKGFQTLDYIKMDKLIKEVLNYNRLLGVAKRNEKYKRKEISNV